MHRCPAGSPMLILFLILIIKEKRTGVHCSPFSLPTDFCCSQNKADLCPLGSAHYDPNAAWVIVFLLLYQHVSPTEIIYSAGHKAKKQNLCFPRRSTCHSLCLEHSSSDSCLSPSCLGLSKTHYSKSFLSNIPPLFSTSCPSILFIYSPGKIVGCEALRCSLFAAGQGVFSLSLSEKSTGKELDQLFSILPFTKPTHG